MKRLSVGVIVDSMIAPAWISQVVADIQKSEFVTLRLIIIAGQVAPDKSLLSYYGKLEQRFFSRSVGADAFAPSDLGSILGASSPYFSLELADPPQLDNKATEIIQQRDLDLLLNLGSYNVSNMTPALTRLGIWTFENNWDVAYQGASPLFACANNVGCAGTLQIRQFDAITKREKIIFKQSFSAYDRLFLRYKNNIYWKSALFITRSLNTFAERNRQIGTTAFAMAGNAIMASSQQPVKKAKTKKGIGFIVSLLYRNILSRLFEEYWAMAVYHRAGQSSKSILTVDPAKFMEVTSPKGRFFADPFLFVYENRNYLFFEDYDYKKGKASISCCTLNEDGSTGDVLTVVECPYHLSYPFVFSHQGSIYMVPESSQNGTIELYECISFPEQWVLKKILMENVIAYDTTLLYQDDCWWLFTTIDQSTTRTADELYLFYSDDLFGQWQPHPMNPIVTSIAGGRSAGRLIEQNQRWIRPAQDCAIIYGRAINFYRIDRLSKEEYAETFISRCEQPASGNYIGLHTYDRTENYEVIDQKKYRLRWTV